MSPTFSDEWPSNTIFYAFYGKSILLVIVLMLSLGGTLGYAPSMSLQPMASLMNLFSLDRLLVNDYRLYYGSSGLPLCLASDASTLSFIPYHSVLLISPSSSHSDMPSAYTLPPLIAYLDVFVLDTVLSLIS